MRKNEPISNIMTPTPACVQQGQPLSDAYKLICNEGFHHVPVVDGEKLVGIVSFTDIMKLNIVLQGIDAHTLHAVIDQQFELIAVMSKRLTTIKESQTVRDAAQLLGKGDFHSLPVVDDTGNLKGIVTSTDLIRYLSEQY